MKKLLILTLILSGCSTPNTTSSSDTTGTTGADITSAETTGTETIDSDSGTADEGNSSDPGNTPDAGPPPDKGSETPSSISLTHLATSEMVLGTHRPELLVQPDGNLMVAVVHPQGQAQLVGSVKHMAYPLDTEGKVNGDGFALTTTTSEFGEPADHRVLIAGNELVVVYQTLIFNDDKPSMGAGGPAEDYAKNQSLMLARFTLDGKESFRGPIVANTTNFEDDNFPDHCMAYNGETLIVSTGSIGKKIRFRMVNLDGQILDTVTVESSPDTVGGTIGNSLFYKGDQLIIVSGEKGMPGAAKPLLFAAIDSAFNFTGLGTFEAKGEDTTFPTGTWVHNGITYIGYSAHEAGGSPDIQVNPYHPRLVALDADWNALAEVKVSEEIGAGHVHPTVVAAGDTLYYAWSRKGEAQGNGPTPPQVLIERYAINAD